MPQRLGQHFLKNRSAIRRIIASLDLQPGETVIEIGPGRGALTWPLAETCAVVGAKLIAIERDKSLVDSLKLLAFRGKENAEILYADALTEIPQIISRYKLTAISYKLVGNIPYYITGQLLRMIGELPVKPRVSVLMIQREVAQRLCAKPGEMNLLAASVQIWAAPKIILNLKPADFDPPPKVHSAVIQLTINSSPLTKEGQEAYYRTIKIIFKQPRKTLLNNLTAGGLNRDRAQELIAAIGGKPALRPQDLSIKQLVTISRQSL